MEGNRTDFSEDLLNRKPLAENLTRIIEKTNDINVIAIDSSWGTGKTTFIKMWQNMINTDERYKDKFETLYFNAWENDYIQDPLLALMTDIEEARNVQNTKAKKVFDKIIENGKKLIKPLINVPLKLGTAGAIGVDDFKLGKDKDEVLKNAVNEKGIREKFKNSIKEVSTSENCKIIFFIDELDRCRPLFAIELLETIKHLFEVENIFFIISVDKDQLAYSISTLYGQGMDSDGYLRRFFDLEYKMPISDKRNYIEFKNNNLFKDYKNTEFLELFLKELFIRDVYSFRDIDKGYEYMKLLIPTIDEFNQSNNNSWKIAYTIVHSYILAEMINIKLKHSNIYKQIINLNYNPTKTDVENMLEFNKLEGINLELENYADGKIKELLLNVMEKYLLTIKLSNNGEKRLYSYSDKDIEETSIIGIKNEDGNYLYDSKLNLSILIENKNLDFIRKMEFLNNF